MLVFASTKDDVTYKTCKHNMVTTKGSMNVCIVNHLVEGHAEILLSLYACLNVV